jgi:hypothetical protein
MQATLCALSRSGSTLSPLPTLERHSLWVGRLCGGPLLRSLLRLQAVQVDGGTLGMSGGAEYRALVVFQHRA